MEEPKKVYGESCFTYINKPLGFATRRENGDNSYITGDETIYGLRVNKATNSNAMVFKGLTLPTILMRMNHNKNNRIVGLVRDKFDDGGLLVSILGNERLSLGNDFGAYYQNISVRPQTRYLTVLGQYLKQPFETTPEISDINVVMGKTLMSVRATDSHGNREYLTQDEAEAWQPVFNKGNYYGTNNPPYFTLNGVNFNPNNNNHADITDDKDTTLSFGTNPITNTTVFVSDAYVNNPLGCLGGNLINFGKQLALIYDNVCPAYFDTLEDFENFLYVGMVPVETFNGCCLPFNLILTENETQAKRYLTDGTLPTDAYLYPLDWDDLPTYNTTEPPDSDDDDDGGNPDDDANPNRDVIGDPVEAPAITPTMFNANNIYWLGITELHNFLIWFWYDIQQFSVLDPTTWDNLFDNIEGLYANLASAVLSVRYFPIKPEWVGGLGDRKRIKLAQIEKDGDVNTISTLNKSPIEKIGSIKIDKQFDSFLDLSPHSQLCLYLPYYGYVDLDIDLFNGHELVVYAVYDILSGTIQYYLYYDDVFMTNTYTAKMCVDIPITLQSAYDRDRTLQSNVATALSGFMSAGAGALSGNPIGLTLGVQALNASVSPQQSAPIRVEGMLSEQGSLYAPSRCFIILRRPTTTKKGNAFANNVGFLWCKSKKLSELSGLTICENPRIHFNGNEYIDEEGHATGIMLLPLESEIEEIYNYMKGGIIL